MNIFLGKFRDKCSPRPPHGCAGGEFHFTPRADAGIGEAFIEKHFDGRGVGLPARGLIDRPVVPIEAQIFHVVHQHRIRARFDARGIEVFDAEDDAPIILAGQKPIDQKRARVSEMQSPGGRRRQTGGGHVWILRRVFQGRVLALSRTDWRNA